MDNLLGSFEPEDSPGRIVKDSLAWERMHYLRQFGMSLGKQEPGFDRLRLPEGSSGNQD